MTGMKECTFVKIIKNTSRLIIPALFIFCYISIYKIIVLGQLFNLILLGSDLFKEK